MFYGWPWGEYLFSLFLPGRAWELNNMGGRRKVEMFPFAGRKVTETYWGLPLVLYPPWTDNSCKSINLHKLKFLPALWLDCFKQILHHPHKKYIGDFKLQGSDWQWQILLQFLQVPLTQAFAPTCSACLPWPDHNAAARAVFLSLILPSMDFFIFWCTDTNLKSHCPFFPCSKVSSLYSDL